MKKKIMVFEVGHQIPPLLMFHIDSSQSSSFNFRDLIWGYQARVTVLTAFIYLYDSNDAPSSKRSLDSRVKFSPLAFYT